MPVLYLPCEPLHAEVSYAGQNIQQIDSLFVGDILGKKSDIADGSLRDWDFRKFEHLVGDYYVAPKFLDAMSVRLSGQYLSAGLHAPLTR